MDADVDIGRWADKNFGTVKLGDRRRTKRLVESAVKIAAHPEKSFTQVFDWNELRGFYRLCDQATATLSAVMSPHWQQTHQAMTEHPVVLILHDTSELDFSSHHCLSGIGQIGNQSGRGFLQHNSLAVVPQPRQVLGLAYQQLKVRRPAPEGESTYQRKRRPRESQFWSAGFRGSSRAPAGCCWVDVCDRGADDYESMRVSREMDHHFLIRVSQNRLVYVTAEHDRQEYVQDYARLLSKQGEDTVDIPGRGGRPARTAQVSMAAAAVWIPAPAGTAQRRTQPVLPVWVIRVWEAHPPVDVDEPLEWILWCSLATTTIAELKQRRDWYCCRWMIEVYHDIEKNGCSEEDRRFETAERMETCLAILSVVAIRVFQLRCALEHQPDASAEQAGTAAEVRLIRRYLKHRSQRLTVREFVRGVAKLGGFLGRKCDGAPGVRALWRGYQRLQDMLLGQQLNQPTPANSS